MSIDDDDGIFRPSSSRFLAEVWRASSILTVGCCGLWPVGVISNPNCIAQVEPDQYHRISISSNWVLDLVLLLLLVLRIYMLWFNWFQIAWRRRRWTPFEFMEAPDTMWEWYILFRTMCSMCRFDIVWFRIYVGFGCWVVVNFTRLYCRDKDNRLPDWGCVFCLLFLRRMAFDNHGGRAKDEFRSRRYKGEAGYNGFCVEILFLWQNLCFLLFLVMVDRIW